MASVRNILRMKETRSVMLKAIERLLKLRTEMYEVTEKAARGVIIDMHGTPPTAYIHALSDARAEAKREVDMLTALRVIVKSDDRLTIIKRGTIFRNVELREAFIQAACKAIADLVYSVDKGVYTREMLHECKEITPTSITIEQGVQSLVFQMAAAVPNFSQLAYVFCMDMSKGILPALQRAFPMHEDVVDRPAVLHELHQIRDDVEYLYKHADNVPDADASAYLTDIAVLTKRVEELEKKLEKSAVCFDP